MEKRLIPYSVHLPEHIFVALKQAAGDRKAASLVREAITMFIENEDAYKRGYTTAIRDVMDKVASNKIANSIAIDSNVVSDVLVKEISSLIN